LLAVWLGIFLLPLNALFLFIEVVQRLLHRRRDILILVAAPVLSWSLAFLFLSFAS
jgi:hypothetical protein